MRHGRPYRVPMGWWRGALRLVLLAHIGVVCTFLAPPVWLLAKAVKRAGDGTRGPRAA